MRVHGKKPIKKFTDSRVERRTETRDAIVWDVDLTNYVARVKIQGSNEFIYAHYPRNWKRIPYWLKQGNAVAIRHRQGVRGWTEVIGEGRAIPTPVSGEAFPVLADLADGILSGMYVTQTYPASMALNISSGWYRLNGVEYYFTAEQIGFMIMDDPAPDIMGSEMPMGLGNYTVEYPDRDLTSGEHIYDQLFIGEDQVVHLVTGESSFSIPGIYEIPSDHLRIGDHILWDWNDTVYLDSMMGPVYLGSWPQVIRTDLSTIVPGQPFILDGYKVSWPASGESLWTTYNIAVFDEDMMPCPAGAGGYDFTAELHPDYGTGWVYSVEDGSDPWHVSTHINYGYQTTMVYIRDITVVEEQPIITIRLGKWDPPRHQYMLKTGLRIQLLDATGRPISGESSQYWT